MLIFEWAEGFVKLLTPYSPSQLKLPKLHNWTYHIVAAIKKHGAINSFTTETYESLHKKWVKNPYRISNRRNATSQMLNTVNKHHDYLIII